MPTIELTAGPGLMYPDIPTAHAAIPANPTSPYAIRFSKGAEYVAAAVAVLSGKNFDETNNLTIEPLLGQGYTENPNILTNALRYNPANGAAIRTGANTLFSIQEQWVTIRGLQLKQGAGDTDQPLIAIRASNVTIENNMIESNAYGNYMRLIYVDNNLSNVVIRNNPVALTNSAKGFASNTKGVLLENNTIVSLGGATKSFFEGSDGWSMVNNAIFGFADYGLPNFMAKCAGNTSNLGAFPVGGLNRTGLVSANQFMSLANDGTYDLRLKTTAALVDAGVTPSDGNTFTVNGVRQQGNSADSGAWENPSSIQAPTAKVTSITVQGTTVTIKGTTTGSPTTGRCTITPIDIPYNSGVKQEALPLTLTAGAFEISIPSVKVGKYSIAGSVGNQPYPVIGISNTLGGFEIVSAYATSATQDPMSGQVQHVHGTYTGNPTSARLLVPADPANPVGALDQIKAVTLDQGNFDVKIPLPAGNFLAGVLTFTNGDGTSLPQAGTRPVKVLGLSGNPAAAGADQQLPPSTVTSVSVSPATATGSTTFHATVQGTNNPPQGVAWSASAGTITSAGEFTAPAAASTMQTITITATSLVDGTKSGTATVTIAAVTTPPVQTPTVTSVTVSPASASMSGGASRQFTASVIGANSPSQAVTWMANIGSISASGLYTAPAAASAAQTATITATSVADGARSGTAVVTIAAVVIVTPPEDPLPEDPPPVGNNQNTVNVTVRAIDQKGRPIAFAVITAKLDRDDVDTVRGYLSPEEFIADTNEAGIAILKLWPNARGLRGSKYKVRIMNPATGTSFNLIATVPDADCMLHKIAVPK